MAETKVKSAPGSTAVAAPTTRRLPRAAPWWRTTLLLVFAVGVVGLAPAAVAARVFGLVNLPSVPGLDYPLASLLPQSPTPTSVDLALPRSAWAAVSVTVRATPGAAAAVARLEPGFPVTLLAHAVVGDVVWDRVSWAGPTAAAGGQGWVPDTALAVVGDAGPAVGDAGALSSDLAAALAASGPNAGLAVYYPAAHQLYLAHADRPCTLGDGARTLLLTALFARAQAAHQPLPGQQPADPARRLAAGDPASGATIYQQLGGSAGLSTFLSDAGLVGVAPGATDWTATQATPRALAQFYAALGGLQTGKTFAGLDADGRAHILALLATDPRAATIAAAQPSGTPTPGAHATLVVGAAQDAAGWTVTATGILVAPSGLTYIVAACTTGQSSEAAGAQGLHNIYAQLATIAAA